MRSHSGRDEARSNMHDPTVRDRAIGHELKKSPMHGRTTDMGSTARKHGQKGNSSHR
jgi:hypothetical protein